MDMRQTRACARRVPTVSASVTTRPMSHQKSGAPPVANHAFGAGQQALSGAPGAPVVIHMLGAAQQPPGVIQARPNQHTIGHNPAKVAKVLGVLHILAAIGLLYVFRYIFAGVVIFNVRHEILWYACCCAMFCITGIIGIVAGAKRTKATTIAFMISSILVLPLVILCLLAGLDVWHVDSYEAASTIGFSTTVTVVAICEGIVTIASYALCGYVFCHRPRTNVTRAPVAQYTTAPSQDVTFIQV